MSATPHQSHAPPAPGRLADHQFYLAFLFAFAVALVRTPFEVAQGIIVGEEGTVYLRFAWDTPVLHALIAPHQGYYSLFANLCGILAARLVPIQDAGHFLFFAELGVQLLLAVVVLQCEAIRSLRNKLLAVALVLLMSPTRMVIFSTVNAQFFFAVITGIILISDANRHRLGRLALILFAGFNGVLSALLFPLFAYEAWKGRSRARAAQAAALIPGGLAQFLIILLHGGMVQGGRSTLGYDAGALLVNGFLGTFFTYGSSIVACKAVGSTKFANHQGVLWGSMEALALLCLVAMLWFLRKGGHLASLLACAALLSLAISYIRQGAVNYELMCNSGGRYFFIANLFFGLALVLVLQNQAAPYKNIAAILIAASLLSGVLDLRQVALSSGYPDWAQGIALWRSDPQHRIQTMPAGWPGVRLTPTHGNASLPFAIYDSTEPGWQNR